MSGTASIPVLILPQQMEIDVLLTTQCICDYHEFDDSSVVSEGSVLLICDPSYNHVLNSIGDALQNKFKGLCVGRITPRADPDNWTPEISKFDSVAADMESIGGLYFNPEAVMNAHTVIYIGEKKEQLVGILLRLSDCRVISCSPQSSNKMELHRGQETKEFRERYVGVMRVKEAEIIGLIVGSMGIDDATMRTLVDQLTRYIEAAGKKCYCFAMGRINEAKLCNFPEINVFCLISNDDTARVPAKTFHVPVVTPFELELGLGAREWDCMYVSSASYSLASDEEYSQRLKLIESGRSRSSSYSSNDTDEVALPSTTVTDSSAMTVKSGSQLTVFHSAAADYLAQRDYRGLESTVPVDQSVDVLPGQFGVASGYDRSGVNK